MILAIAVVLSGAAAMARPPVALAVTLCYANGGTYSNNQEVTLGYSWTFQSDYGSHLDYVAKRYDIYSNPTLNHYQDVSVYGQNYTFTNPVDAYRRTAMQRGGYSSTNWGMNQWAQGSCF
ncbi:MAG TPA: hypothetical protein VIM23_03150 [Gaiellaceae bacterium]